MINKSSKKQYGIDQTFPPEYSSLMKHPDKVDSKEQEKYKKLTWIHYTDLSEFIISKVVSRISYLKILQGQISNCYLTDILSSLAMIPERIQRLFSKSDKTSRNKFEVIVYPEEVPTTIEVDGYFPYFSPCNSLYFTRSSLSELWALILEKAWAKHLGSYSDIAFADPTLAFTFFTGFHTEYVMNSDMDEEKLWSELIECQEKKFPMICKTRACHVVKENMNYKALNLIAGHSYSLLEVKVEGYRKDKRVVKLRNSWGKIDWAEGLGLGYTIPTKSIIKRGDGLLSIAFSDFYKYFLGVIVCRYNEKSVKEKAVKPKRLSVENSPGEHSKEDKLTISSEGEIPSVIDLGSGNMRTRTEIPLTDNFFETVIIFKVDKPCQGTFQIIADNIQKGATLEMLIGYKEPSFEYITSEQLISNKLSVEVTFDKPGICLCFITVHDAFNYGSKKLIFSLTSDSINEQEIIDDNSKRINYLYSILKSCALKIGEKAELAEDIYSYNCFASINNDYSAVVYMNQSKNKTLYYEVNYKEKGAVQILPPFEDEASYRLIIKPGEEQLVCMRRNKNFTNFVYGVKISLEHPLDELIQMVKAKKLECVKDTVIDKGFNYKVYQHGFGFLLEFVNSTEDILFIAKFDYTLTNLKLIEETAPDSISFELNPKETKYAQLRVLDAFKLEIMYSVKYVKNSKKVGGSDEEIIKEVISSGKKLQIPKKDAFIASKYINSNYCIYVSNGTKDILEANITFKGPKNLDCNEGEVWKVIINPDEGGFLRVIKQLDPFKATSCAFGVSFSFKPKK